MAEYNVHLKNGRIVVVDSKYVKVSNVGAAIFYNDRLSLTDQYINGPEIVATFNIEDYSYFKKII